MSKRKREKIDKQIADVLLELGYHYKYDEDIQDDVTVANALSELDYYYEYEEMQANEQAKALYQLGKCYMLGIKVTRDVNKAVQCYDKSANLGYPDAQFNLALCYEIGKGVSKDEDKALYWFCKAAKQGLAEATSVLDAIIRMVLCETIIKK